MGITAQRVRFALIKTNNDTNDIVVDYLLNHPDEKLPDSLSSHSPGKKKRGKFGGLFGGFGSKASSRSEEKEQQLHIDMGMDMGMDLSSMAGPGRMTRTKSDSALHQI